MGGDAGWDSAFPGLHPRHSQAQQPSPPDARAFSSLSKDEKGFSITAAAPARHPGLCRGRSVPGSRDVTAGALRTGDFAVTASKGGGNDDSRTTRVQGAASGRHSPAGDAPPLSPAGSPPSQVMFPRTPPCWWPQGIPHPQLTCVVDATHSAVAQPLSPRGRSL